MPERVVTFPTSLIAPVIHLDQCQRRDVVPWNPTSGGRGGGGGGEPRGCGFRGGAVGLAGLDDPRWPGGLPSQHCRLGDDGPTKEKQ